MLELKNVKKFYKTKSGEVAALNGVSLTFPSSGMVFISGKSGCGKTTLLNVVGGIDGIDEGEISLLGKSFESFSQGDYDDYRNTFIGFIFQEYNLLSEFTVEKNIEIAMELQGRKSNREEVDALLKEMEIEGLRNKISQIQSKLKPVEPEETNHLTDEDKLFRAQQVEWEAARKAGNHREADRLRSVYFAERFNRGNVQ
jgi:ABC-type lipoprotein export system ATPase subunit